MSAMILQTWSIGINLSGYFSLSSSKPGKKSSKKNKERPKEKREEQVLPDDMYFSSQQLGMLFLKPNLLVCTCRLLWLLVFYWPCHCSWKCKVNSSAWRQTSGVRWAKTSGLRLLWTKQWEGQERMAVTISLVYILLNFRNPWIYFVCTWRQWYPTDTVQYTVLLQSLC